MVGLTVSSTHQISINRTLCHCTGLGIHHTTSTHATANRATECSHMHKYLLNSNSASSTSKLLYMSAPGSRLRRLSPFRVRKWPIPWYENIYNCITAITRSTILTQIMMEEAAIGLRQAHHFHLSLLHFLSPHPALLGVCKTTFLYPNYPSYTPALHLHIVSIYYMYLYAVVSSTSLPPLFVLSSLAV